MFARADTIVKHPDLMEGLRNIGLVYVTTGIESIRDEELDAMNKKTTVAINDEAIRTLQRLGIANGAHFIVNPNFTRQDFRQLLRYVKDRDFFQPVFTVLTPYPGTDLYEENQDKILIKDFDYYDVMHSIFPTRLSRKVFYRELERLYIGSYALRRYLWSLGKELWGKLTNSKLRKIVPPDRLPFLTMVLLQPMTLPLRWKYRRLYKSEPIAGQQGATPSR